MRGELETTAGAIADAAARWRDADFPPRVRATRAIRTRLGYSEPVVDFALDALFGSIDRATILATIANELGSLDAFDRFVSRPSRPAVGYRGVSHATIISSDTTIGVALPATIFALCAGARVLVKDRDDKFVAAFTETLREESPAVASRLETAAWEGNAAPAEGEPDPFARAGTVVAYGRDASLTAIRARIPATTRFVGFGHATSIGYVGARALCSHDDARACARNVARDALLYDGEGCLSPHALFVERGGTIDVETFATLLGDALDEAAVEFPFARASLDDRVLAYRRAATFRAANGSGTIRVASGAAHTLVVEPPRSEPPPLLPRVLALYSIADRAEIIDFVRRHRIPLEAVGIGVTLREIDIALPDEMLAFAIACGASRVAHLGDLQRPPLAGNHGGEGRIIPFVRAISNG